jgi:hypothetical protein
MKPDIVELHLNRRYDLIKEAEQERLAAQLPPRRSVLRHAIAVACERVADWLDSNANQYVQPATAGPADWAAAPTSAYIWRADSVTPPAARDSSIRPTDQLILR